MFLGRTGSKRRGGRELNQSFWFLLLKLPVRDLSSLSSRRPFQRETLGSEVSCRVSGARLLLCLVLWLSCSGVSSDCREYQVLGQGRENALSPSLHWPWKCLGSEFPEVLPETTSFFLIFALELLLGSSLRSPSTHTLGK